MSGRPLTFTPMTAASLHFQAQARYYTLGELSAHTRQIWFVLHGYGQLARYFLPKFQPLVSEHVFLVAPEGLSHFYLEDIATRTATGNQRVGATWMTRENRDMDISNYLTYLTAVYKATIHSAACPVSLLGFSQGAATASRWAVSQQIDFHRLILWAGIFPPDMDLKTGHNVLSEKAVVTVHGLQDPFINSERLAEMATITQQLNISTRQLTFDGGHELNTNVLLQLARESGD